MSLDDQLLKPDGTFITAIDICILKLARFIAKLFVKEDEETFNQATKRMLKLSGHMFLVCAGASALCMNIFMAFSWLGLNDLANQCLYAESRFKGFGTNIPLHKKYRLLIILTMGSLTLSALSMAISSIMSLMFVIPGSFLTITIAGIVCGFSHFFFYLTIGYAERLGSIPPKKKRVRQLKPALAPH